MAYPGLDKGMSMFDAGVVPRNTRNLSASTARSSASSMATAGRSRSLPPYQGPGRAGNPSHWMVHDSMPREPYTQRTASKAVAAPPLKRPQDGNLGMTSQIGTGGETADNRLYQEAHGEMLQRNRRHGYFRNPDWDRPRPGPPMTDQHEGSEKYRRSGGLCQRAKTPPRALPGDTAAFWAEGKRTSEHRNDTKVAFVDKSGTSHGKIFFRTEDNVWATRDVVDEAHRKKVTAASEVQAVAKREVQIKAARAKAEREAALVPTKDMFATQGVPPRSKSHLEGLPTPAEERESRHLDAIDGWHIKGTKKREGKQVRVHTVQNEINKHDQGETRYEPRVEMKVADAKYRAQYRKGLDAEVEQRAAARAAEREAERATSKNEQGYTAQLGRWGCGAPNVNEDGTVMAKLPVSIAHVPIPRAEEGYVETIEQQIAEQREARERLDAAHRFQKHEVFDPFQKTKDKHKPHKTIAGQHGMADVAGAPIDGSSLANVMGTPGGGAPVQHGDNADRHPMAEDQLEAQYKLELQAQKEGRSQWGKQGCGAPLRTKEGAIVRSSRGAAEGDTNGVNDYKRTHNLRRAQKKVLEDQTQFLATMHERRKKEAAEDRRLEDEAIRVGGVMGRTQEEKKTAKRAPGFFDPPPPRRNADAKVLDKQLAEKKQAQRRQKEVDDALAATHNAVAMEWVGKGQGEVKRHPETGDPLAHKAHDPVLHYDVNAGNPVVFKSRSAKARYHKDLDQTVRARSGVKKANRERVVLEENTHAATANRFEGRPGGGNPVRNADGEIRSKRVAPQGEAGEYRLLCKPIPALL